jgi:hypothetical protein
MTEPGMYMPYAHGMDEERQEPNPEVEREERRLERLRLVSVVSTPEQYDDDDEPGPAAA